MSNSAIPERGKVIVIEGAEGVGKSTQAERLAGRLAVHGYECRTDVREPGGTPMGEELRALLKNQDIPRQPQTNLSLFNAARVELIGQVIEPELTVGRWVVCDRNRLSSHAYQGHGEGMNIEYVRAKCADAIGDILPDLIELVLYCDETERRDRLEKRGGTDYFESQGSNFHQRVVAGYEIEAKALGLSYIDGNGSVDEVHECLWQHVEPLLNSKGVKNE